MDSNIIKELTLLYMKNQDNLSKYSPIELLELYKKTYDEMEKYYQENHGKWMW